MNDGPHSKTDTNLCCSSTAKNGNPERWTPTPGNMPRIDAETSIGIVTDVCLKRKVRNYVELATRRRTGIQHPDQDG